MSAAHKARPTRRDDEHDGPLVMIAMMMLHHWAHNASATQWQMANGEWGTTDCVQQLARTAADEFGPATKAQACQSQ